MNQKKVMARFWDERARDNPFHFIASDVVTYDQPDIDAFFASGEKEVGRFLAAANYIPSSDETMLEIGCGIGRMTRAFATRFGTVYSIDISQEMIAQARNYLADYPNVHLSVSNGTDLCQFGNSSIDFCFSYIVFQHIPDPAITLRYIHEISRVLKPGGTAYFQVNTDVPSLIGRLRNRLGLRTRLRALLHHAPGEPNYDSPAWRGSSLPVTTLRRTIEAAGLHLENLNGIGTQYTWVLARK